MVQCVPLRGNGGHMNKVVFVAALGGLAGPAAADIINVPADYPTIQAAIEAARDGDVVLVADGVYTGPGNTNVGFLGKPITVRSQNGPQHCIIDGQLNARGFSFFGSEGPDSVLDGFSIINGFGSPGGGGIHIQYASSPTIRNCVITDCYGFDFGGAIRIMDGSPKIIGCTFAENYTDWFGGGLFIWGGHTTIVDCVFSGNNGLAFGGGLYVYHNSEVTVTHCAFIGNYHSGIDLASSTSSATIVNCLFAGNVSGGIVASNASPEIINCTLVDNTHSSGAGGLDAAGSGAAVVNNCILWGNVGAGQVDDGDTIVNFSIVEGGWRGPGEGNSAADPLFAPGPGGAWTVPSVFDPVANATVFTDANASFEPHALTGRQLNPDLRQSRLLHILDNGRTTISVAGNFTATFVGPYAAPKGDEPYQVLDARVRSGSPAIDAGNNAAVPPGILTDLAGQPRFADDPATPDSGPGTPPIVDRGAYEFQPCLADLDADGAIGTADLLDLLGAWGACRGKAACAADLDGDGMVGLGDLLLLVAAWGPCR